MSRCSTRAVASLAWDARANGGGPPDVRALSSRPRVRRLALCSAPRGQLRQFRFLAIKRRWWNAALSVVSSERGRGVPEQPDGIGLAEALEQLRAELAAAHTKAADSNVQFPIETLTVELKVAV